ncbi:hypothetical protein [Mycobacterium hubeiense]|uniref:hypothetical protein n=1 Tax=Mycobacterium hubeiense TaxID=1867256 RepID=UPI001156FB96|nr:hypothetical protein [Mycobacterium sp. QGD 101]
MIAVAATLSGSAFGDSAIACADTQGWDEAAYQECVTGYEAQKEDDYVSWYEGVKGCCKGLGGVWHDQQPGQEARCDPPKPRFDVPPVGGISEVLTPAPPPPPVRQPPGVINETLAPVHP